MTDYLELAVREDADALREAERRLALLRMPFLVGKTVEQGRPGRPEEQERPGELRRPERPGSLKRARKTGEGSPDGTSPAKSSAGALAERQAVLDSGEGESPVSAGALLLEQLWRWETPVRRERGRKAARGRETAPGSGLVPDPDPVLFPGGDRDQEIPRDVPAGLDREDPWSAFSIWNREAPRSAFAVWDWENQKEERPALLDQLEQAERAAEVNWALGGRFDGRSGPAESAGSPGPRPPEQGFLPRPDGPGGGWTGFPGRETARQEGEDLARQIDRAFQRDARRYDGGFFLY